VKFVDAIGNPLPLAMLEYRSLEGESTQALNLSSKGCLALDKPGLWLIRHREKPEGLILDLSKVRASTVLSLQDISGENLKPVCPAFEVGRKLDLRTVLDSQAGHDLRGYEISFSIESDKIQKTWPRQNFSMLQSIELAGVFPEGEMKLDIRVINNFRSGEQTAKICSVKFDYTGPIIRTSLANGQNKAYKGRPFVALSSDQDVRFTSSANDFQSFDICYHKLSDWDLGDLKELFPLCDKPERIPADRPVPFESRKGFWQLAYRGVDRAGNVSEWSQPMVILIEQQNARLQLINKATKQASDLDRGGYRYTPYSMLDALEIYNDWQGLPTSFERDQLESSILLIMHRPWMEPSVAVPLRVAPLNHYPKVAFPVAHGKKFVSIEGVFEAGKDYFFKATLVDMQSLLETSMPAPKYLPSGWQVSKDGTKFFWFTISGVHYGKLSGDEVKVQELNFEDDYVSSVRFIKDDSELAIVTTRNKNKITYYQTGEQLVESNSEPLPIDIWSSDIVPSVVRLTDDARSIWMKNLERNSLEAWSLYESEGRKPLDFDPALIPNFSINSDSIRVLDSDKHLFITYTYDRFPFCSYYYYDSDQPDRLKSQRLLEAMPCFANDDGTPNGSDVWLAGANDIAAFIYKPGSASFSKSVLSYELPAGAIEYSSDRMITRSGRWMFSGSKEQDSAQPSLTGGHIRAWTRSQTGDFVQFAEFWGCGEIRDPREFQFDEANLVLIHACHSIENDIFVWSLAENPPRLIDVLDIGDAVTSTLIVSDKLMVGTNKGEIHFYKLNGKEKPGFEKKVKLVDQPIAKLTYDKELGRLYTTEARGEKPLKIWQLNELSKPIMSVPALPRENQRTVLSDDLKYLAASSDQDTRVVIWNTEDMMPLTFYEHSNAVLDIALIGKSPLLVSGSSAGELKIWDIKNPEFPAVSFMPALTEGIRNIATVPGVNEFVVETAESGMFHYKLQSMKNITNKTCEALRMYLHYMQEVYPKQAAFCKSQALGR
jgi:WD40 repeat protein